MPFRQLLRSRSLRLTLARSWLRSLAHYFYNLFKNVKINSKKLDCLTVFCCQRSCCIGVEHSCTLVWRLKKAFNYQVEYNMFAVLPSKSRLEPLSHILSAGMLPYIQSPLKIRPKSFALNYCANAPYYHPGLWIGRHHPSGPQMIGLLCLWSLSEVNWSGSLHLSLWLQFNACSLSSTVLKESPFD